MSSWQSGKPGSLMVSIDPPPARLQPWQTDELLEINQLDDISPREVSDNLFAGRCGPIALAPLLERVRLCRPPIEKGQK